VTSLVRADAERALRMLHRYAAATRDAGTHPLMTCHLSRNPRRHSAGGE
jgi:hypothetical protein